MGRTLNALVLGVGGNVSQSIQKAIALSSVPTRVVAACISPDAPGLYLADSAYLSPLAHDDEFVPWLLETCERERIDVILSGSEAVLDVLAPLAQQIRRETGAFSLVSSPEILRTGRDKLLTCRWLEERGLPVPGYAEVGDQRAVDRLLERCGFPLVAKPRFGKGGDAILRLDDERHLGEVLRATDMGLGRRAPDMILQQYLGSDAEEFTAGCFCDADGAVVGTIVMRRALRSGTTVTAELGRFPEVREAASAIVAALQPLGPCNVQLRMHDGRAVPFEINPRFSGTTGVRARMGFNEVDAALRHFVLGEPPPSLADIGSGFALRYWNEMYVSSETVGSLRLDQGLSDLAPHVDVERWGWQ